MNEYIKNKIAEINNGMQTAYMDSSYIVLKEHEAAKWLKKEELNSVEWLPADKGLIQLLQCGME